MSRQLGSESVSHGSEASGTGRQISTSWLADRKGEGHA